MASALQNDLPAAVLHSFVHAGSMLIIIFLVIMDDLDLICYTDMLEIIFWPSTCSLVVTGHCCCSAVAVLVLKYVDNYER